MSNDTLTPLAFTKLVVRDLHEETKFYRTVFGYDEGQFIRGSIDGRAIEEFVLTGRDGKIELMLLAFLDGPMPSPSGIILGFFTHDIEALQARVIDAGGKIVQPIGPLPMAGTTLRLAFYSDPEGYLLEVIER